ncbi:MAG TPA: response regulator, partial [Myxococcales bacterium]|nr:response regulator [Myxococcales bacterium]
MNVLIVDDQRSARRVLTDILSAEEGMSLREAASLEEARKVLATTRVDVALIDIRLGEDLQNRDGLTLVKEIREKTDAIPLVVSQSSEMGQIRAAMRAGAYDYVLKDELCEELVVPIVRAL